MKTSIVWILVPDDKGLPYLIYDAGMSGKYCNVGRRFIKNDLLRFYGRIKTRLEFI